MMNDKRLSNCMLYPAGLYGAKTAMFTYTKTILVWFYTPSMNHGKRSAKVHFGKPAAGRLLARAWKTTNEEAHTSRAHPR